MKKILFTAAIAAVAAASCTKSDMVGIRQDVATDGISFNAYTSGATRAEDITTTNVTDEKFLLQAYTTDGLYNAAASAPVYSLYSDTDAGYDDALVYDATVQGWFTKNTYGTGENTIYFWPTSENNYLSFFATNADNLLANQTAGTSPMTAPTAAMDYPSFEYTVGDVGAMQDLLVANTMNGKEGVVSLNFQHALAKLNFKAQGASDGGQYSYVDSTGATIDVVNDYTYVVKKITIKDLTNNGTFTFNGDETDSTVPGAWTAAAQASTAEYVYDLTNVEDANKTGQNTDVISLALTAGADDNSLLIMPQSDTEIEIEIEYTVTWKDLIVFPLKADHTVFDATTEEADLNAAITAQAASMTIQLGDDTFTFAPRSNTTLTLVLPSPGAVLDYLVDVDEWDAEKEYSTSTDTDANKNTTVTVTSTDENGVVTETATTTDSNDAVTKKVTVTDAVSVTDETTVIVNNYIVATAVDTWVSGTKTVTNTATAGTVTVGAYTLIEDQTATWDAAASSQTVTSTVSNVANYPDAVTKVEVFPGATTENTYEASATTTTYYDVDGKEVVEDVQP